MKRKDWYQVHSFLGGIFIGSLLLIIGLTGSLLVFGHQIDQLIWPERLKVEDSPRLSLDEIRTQLNSQLGDHLIVRWRYNSGSNRPDVVQFYPVSKDGKVDFTMRSALVDPVTGKLKGGKSVVSPHLSARRFIIKLHYTLFLGKVGYFITGVVGLCLIALSLTGIYLYRNFWKNFFRLRFRESSRILFSDLHKFIGITTMIFNIILGFTGAWWAARATIVRPLAQMAKKPAEKNRPKNIMIKMCL